MMLTQYNVKWWLGVLITPVFYIDLGAVESIASDGHIIRKSMTLRMMVSLVLGSAQ